MEGCARIIKNDLRYGIGTGGNYDNEVENKLMDFLQKEVPSNASDLNNSINSTLEIIDRTRAAIMGRMNKLARSGRHNDARRFFDADEQLMNIENYLKEFISDIQTGISQEQSEINNTVNKTVVGRPDYASYKVDETEPHNLDEDFLNKKPVGFILDGKKYSVRNWNRLLVMVCEILSQKDYKLFQSFPDDESMQGRTRRYFSRSPMKYSCKKIGGTNIYVLTNNNGNGSCSIVARMLEKYNIPTTSMEIFLRADYTPLHEDEDKKSSESDIEKKIGEYARDYFTVYFSSVGKLKMI